MSPEGVVQAQKNSEKALPGGSKGKTDNTNGFRCPRAFNRYAALYLLLLASVLSSYFYIYDFFHPHHFSFLPRVRKKQPPHIEFWF